MSNTTNSEEIKALQKEICCLKEELNSAIVGLSYDPLTKELTVVFGNDTTQSMSIEGA